MNEDIKDSLDLALDTFGDATFLAQNERYRGAIDEPMLLCLFLHCKRHFSF